MRNIVSSIAIALLGFWAYPLLFVPLMVKLSPVTLNKWIEVYASYLRLWGIN